MKPGISVVEAAHSLCQVFIKLEWSKWKVAVSAAGAIGIYRNNVVAHAAVMTEDGSVNAAQFVTPQHLEMSSTRMAAALPEFADLVWQALATQKIQEHECVHVGRRFIPPPPPPLSKAPPISPRQPQPLREKPQLQLDPHDEFVIQVNPRNISEGKTSAPSGPTPPPTPQVAGSAAPPAAPSLGPLAAGAMNYGSFQGHIIAPAPSADAASLPLVLLLSGAVVFGQQTRRSMGKVRPARSGYH